MVALPVLEAMLPSMTAYAQATGGAGAKAFPKRLAYIYLPNGMNMNTWVPETTGADYTLSPTLEPLAPHKNDFSVITGLAQHNADGMGDAGGGHARASATYLTSVHIKKSASDIHAGISSDQVIANAIGGETRFPSLELSCDHGQEAGSCDSGYSCAYQFNISWRSETQPMLAEIEPKLVFDRLFGNNSVDESAEAAARRQKYDKSVLDFVADSAKRLQSNVGASDRRKLDEYFTAIREVELRIQKNGQMPPPLPEGAAPNFNDDYTFPSHMRLMFDIMTLAFQTDSTRVATFVVAHDGSNRPYPFAGVSQGHHHLSHHRNQASSLANLAIIDKWHASQLAYFLDRLKSVNEGDSNLLDNSMIMYGSGLADGNAHSNYNMPTIVAGRAGGTITPGRHINVANGDRNDYVPIANLHLALQQRMGVKTDRFADSTAALEAIA